MFAICKPAMLKALEGETHTAAFAAKSGDREAKGV